MCDSWCDGIVKDADIQSMEPVAVSKVALEYIDSTWGLFWLLHAEYVNIGRDDLLLKQAMLEYLNANIDSNDWEGATNGCSPEEWVAQNYPKPEKHFMTGTVVITVPCGHRAFRIVFSGRTYARGHRWARTFP